MYEPYEPTIGLSQPYIERARPCYTYQVLGWLWRMAWAIPMAWALSLEEKR